MALTRSLAVEWGSHNIRVNAIGTGWSVAEDIPVEVQQEEQLVRYIPMRKKGAPPETSARYWFTCAPKPATTLPVSRFMWMEA